MDLYEMRPVTRTEAHVTGHLAELVCSNSFRSRSLTTGAGLLKEEMRRMGSLTIELGEAHQVPAGAALAVDRTRFARAVSERLASLPGVRLVRRELEAIPPGLTIVATGFQTEESYEGQDDHIDRLLADALTNGNESDLDLPPFLRRFSRARMRANSN